MGRPGFLFRQKFRVQGHGRPQVHQTAQEPPLLPLLPGKPLPLGPVLGHLRQQCPVEGLELFQPVHGAPPSPSFSTACTGQMRKQFPQWRHRLSSITRGISPLMQPEGHTLRHP